VVINEKINETERTRVHSPPRATSFLKTYVLEVVIYPWTIEVINLSGEGQTHTPSSLKKNMNKLYYNPHLITMRD
jgi:hypothetical protein